MTATRSAPVTARRWHAATLLVAVLSVGTQLVLVATNVNVGFGKSDASLVQRLVEFVSYFTIESNVLVAVAAAMLVADPTRDSPFFRVLRIASMFGITVTLVMYHLFLAPIATFTGVASVSNVGLHYVVPGFAIVGWVLFGPHPRVTWRALFLALIWPAAFIVLTVVQGEITGFYPYPFVNIDDLGLARVALNGLGIVALLLVVGSLYKVTDTAIARRPQRAAT